MNILHPLCCSISGPVASVAAALAVAARALCCVGLLAAGGTSLHYSGVRITVNKHSQLLCGRMVD